MFLYRPTCRKYSSFEDDVSKQSKWHEGKIETTHAIPMDDDFSSDVGDRRKGLLCSFPFDDVNE